MPRTLVSVTKLQWQNAEKSLERTFHLVLHEIFIIST